MYTSPIHGGSQGLVLCEFCENSQSCCVFRFVIAVLGQNPVFDGHSPKTQAVIIFLHLLLWCPLISSLFNIGWVYFGATQSAETYDYPVFIFLCFAIFCNILDCVYTSSKYYMYMQACTHRPLLYVPESLSALDKCMIHLIFQLSFCVSETPHISIILRCLLFCIDSQL